MMIVVLCETSSSVRNAHKDKPQFPYTFSILNGYVITLHHDQNQLAPMKARHLYYVYMSSDETTYTS